MEDTPNLTDLIDENNRLKKEIVGLETMVSQYKSASISCTNIINRNQELITNLQNKITKLETSISANTPADPLVDRINAQIRLCNKELSDMTRNNEDLTRQLKLCNERNPDKEELASKLKIEQETNTNLHVDLENATQKLSKCQQVLDEYKSKAPSGPLINSIQREKEALEQLRKLREILSQKDKEIEELTTSSTAPNPETEKQFNIQKSLIDTQSTEIDKLRQKNTELTEKLETMTEQLTNCTEEVSSFKKSIQEGREKIQQQLENIEDEFKNIKDSFEYSVSYSTGEDDTKLFEEVENVWDAVNNIKKEVDKSSEFTKESLNTWEKMNNELQETIQQLENISQELKDCRKENEKSTYYSEKNKSNEAVIADLGDEINELNAEIETYQAHITDSKKNEKDLQTRNEELTKQLETTTTELTNYTANFKKLMEKMEEMKNEAEADVELKELIPILPSINEIKLGEKLERCNQNIVLYNNKLTDLQQIISQQNTELDNLREEIRRIKLDTSLPSVPEYTLNIKDNNKPIDDPLAIIRTQRLNIEMKTKEIQKLQAKIQKLSDDKTLLESVIASMQEKERELEDIIKKGNEGSLPSSSSVTPISPITQPTSSDSDVDSFFLSPAYINHLKVANKDLTEDNEELTEQVKKLTADNNSLEAIIVAMKITQNELEDTIKKLNEESLPPPYLPPPIPISSTSPRDDLKILRDENNELTEANKRINEELTILVELIGNFSKNIDSINKTVSLSKLPPNVFNLFKEIPEEIELKTPEDIRRSLTPQFNTIENNYRLLFEGLIDIYQRPPAYSTVPAVVPEPPKTKSSEASGKKQEKPSITETIKSFGPYISSVAFAIVILAGVLSTLIMISTSHSPKKHPSSSHGKTSGSGPSPTPTPTPTPKPPPTPGPTPEPEEYTKELVQESVVEATRMNNSYNILYDNMNVDYRKSYYKNLDIISLEKWKPYLMGLYYLMLLVFAISLMFKNTTMIEKIKSFIVVAIASNMEVLKIFVILLVIVFQKIKEYGPNVFMYN